MVTALKRKIKWG